VAQKPLDVPDGVDGHKKSQKPDDHKEITGQEIEPEMKREIGKADRQNELLGNAACDGPYTGRCCKKRSECGEGKTRCNEETLVPAQKRGNQEEKEKKQKGKEYYVKR
jgi:hypothetical protein